MSVEDERAAYAETLLHLSARIVGTVRDEGPEAISRAIDQALIVQAPAGIDPAVALITVLAAQVDAGQRQSTSLGWVLDRQHVVEVLKLRRRHYPVSAA